MPRGLQSGGLRANGWRRDPGRGKALRGMPLKDPGGVRGREACIVTLVLNHFSAPMPMPLSHSLSLTRFFFLPFFFIMIFGKPRCREPQQTAEAGRYSNHHHRRNGREGGTLASKTARGGGGKNEDEDAALKIGSKRAPSGRTRKARTQEGIPSCLTWYVPCKVARERDGKALAPSSSSRLSAREREFLKLTHAPLPFRTFRPPPPPDSCKARG